MGHVTCLGAALDDALATARAIKRDLGIPGRRPAVDAKPAQPGRSPAARPRPDAAAAGSGLHALPRRSRRRRHQGRGHRRRRLCAHPRQSAGHGRRLSFARSTATSAALALDSQGCARPRGVPRAREARRRHRRGLSAGGRRHRSASTTTRSRRSIRASSTRRSPATARAGRARTSPDTTSTTSATPACSTRPARATARRRCATCRSPTCSAAPPRRRSAFSPRSSARSAPGAAATSTSR